MKRLAQNNDYLPNLQVVECDEVQWETPRYLSHYEQMFVLGLHERISMYIGEGDAERYQHLTDLGLVAVQEYTYFNRHVSLTQRGRQIARQIRQRFWDIPYAKFTFDLYRVMHSEYKIMVYGHR